MRSALLVLIVISTLGCGSSEKQQAAKRRSAQQSFDAGVAAFESGDYAVAEHELTAALELGGLYPDLYETAQATRAVSVAAQGKFDAAHALLDKLKQSGLEKDLLFSARSAVLAKQGKIKVAKAAWAKARRFNRNVNKFKY